jgi:hypothetical protein
MAILAGTLALVALRWPYTQERMIASVERATGSKVKLQQYRARFFPQPGCTIENLTIDRHVQQPIARADRITVQSSWWSVLTFRKRIRHIQTERLHIQISSPFPPPVRTGPSKGLGEVVIGQFVADGTTLDISANNDAPRRFVIHQLRLKEVGNDKQITYAAMLDIPDPPGQLKSLGTVGPFPRDERGKTPVAGSFELHRASLERYKGLAGSINATGTFHGPVENIRVTGSAVASGFEVNRSGHPLNVRTRYRADVNGQSGDVILQVEADFLRTRLLVNGFVTGEHGKTVSVQFLAHEARIEDLLSMFTRSEQPALEGPIQLRAHVDLPSVEGMFLQRLVLRGGFGITDARWARPRTQMKVNSLSARARGDKKQVEDRTADQVDHVVSQLRGEVSLKDGLALLSRVSFRVPGATANGGGTYNLLTKRVALKGTVSMLADASEATSGFKSILLKPFNALFRRNKAKGATLPASITGQYPRPEYRIGLRR